MWYGICLFSWGAALLRNQELQERAEALQGLQIEKESSPERAEKQGGNGCNLRKLR
jgi:hypothetical protein